MSGRITLDMTMMGAIVALVEGNPGAIVVCTGILKEAPKVDPDCPAGELHLLRLDDLSIYGPRIWMLYKDLCGESIPKTIGMLRAVQLGVITAKELNEWVDDGYAHKPLVDATLAETKKRLPSLVV